MDLYIDREREREGQWMDGWKGRCGDGWTKWGTDGQGWSCGKDYRAWQEEAQGSTYTVPVEDIGQLVSSQLHVRPQLGPRPAHSHLACGDRLELEVPAATLHHIGFLCPEDAHPVPARLALHQTYTWGQAESQKDRVGCGSQNTKRMVGDTRGGKDLGWLGGIGPVSWC